MANRMVTASMPMRRKAKKAKSGKVEGLVIDVATNGFTAYCRHESDPGVYDEPEKKVFNSLEDLVGYVRESLSGAVKDEAAEY